MNFLEFLCYYFLLFALIQVNCDTSPSPSNLPSSTPSVLPSFLHPSSKPSFYPSSKPSIYPSSKPSIYPSSKPSFYPSSKPSIYPSSKPSIFPSSKPSIYPSSKPSFYPSSKPSIFPSSKPSIYPSSKPSFYPSSKPSLYPSSKPSFYPSSTPSSYPSSKPSIFPSSKPSIYPSSKPSFYPSSKPSSYPSSKPSIYPSSKPSIYPSSKPSFYPSSKPSSYPSSKPSFYPSSKPSIYPSSKPSLYPSAEPSSIPSSNPSSLPSLEPTSKPTIWPSSLPSEKPSSNPSTAPSAEPTTGPSSVPSQNPTSPPTSDPSTEPSYRPTSAPSGLPSIFPSSKPTGHPTCHPSSLPSSRPTEAPSTVPTDKPSGLPSLFPSGQPSSLPSNDPSSQPSSIPSIRPTSFPSSRPSIEPSTVPSSNPSTGPSVIPSSRPSAKPSIHPTSQPTVLPSVQPSVIPSARPTALPSMRPSTIPSRQPSSCPTSQPSTAPSSKPTFYPSVQPSAVPTTQPSNIPSSQPTTDPTSIPTIQPSASPTSNPTVFPSSEPTGRPSVLPSSIPSTEPSECPSSQPTSAPSDKPSSLPSGKPSCQPTSTPTCKPSCIPSTQPSSTPTSQPTGLPTCKPSYQPSGSPSSQPSVIPSMRPSSKPSSQPSSMPSGQPTFSPTTQPTSVPSSKPSALPSGQPSSFPSVQPSSQPTTSPTSQPSSRPTSQPSSLPTAQPSSLPSSQPTSPPSSVPSSQPSSVPSAQPTSYPTVQPTTHPTVQPSSSPTAQPSSIPSAKPSSQPSAYPSSQPTVVPSSQPTAVPSSQPSLKPTSNPSSQPTTVPSSQPSSWPSTQPTVVPSSQPTVIPSTQPTAIPSSQPSSRPSSQPSSQPTTIPSSQPSSRPSSQPTAVPSSQPTVIPSTQPTAVPSAQPSSQPSSQPSARPSSQPSTQPSAQPTSQPSNQPTAFPSSQPSSYPSAQPSSQPTSRPSSQPSSEPSSQPTSQPSDQPSSQPTSRPTMQPSGRPSSQPSSVPTGQPSSQPSAQPSGQPSSQPTAIPSSQPTVIPSTQPTSQPTSQPSSQPTSLPTAQPSSRPSRQPTGQPTTQPTSQPSSRPSSQPTDQPTSHPTTQPSSQPSSQPSDQPSSQPTSLPTSQPTTQPTTQPSAQPSGQPSSIPSAQPTSRPSGQPSSQPTSQPSSRPTRQPTSQPSSLPSTQPSNQPSAQPSSQPSSQPTSRPSVQPSSLPTSQPSSQPTSLPTNQPSGTPTTQPSGIPTSQPTSQPSDSPTAQPTSQPSSQPTRIPTTQPSSQPTSLPSTQPTDRPSTQPTSRPSGQPSSNPTTPSSQPTEQPTSRPTGQPTSQPTRQPTSQPTRQPTTQPTGQPTRRPSSQPTGIPTMQPSGQPSSQPSTQPSVQPSGIPTTQPTSQPTAQPSSLPSSQPSSVPSSQPTSRPSMQPTSQPTSRPTSQPSSQPSEKPSSQPSAQPSSQPTTNPTSQPSRQPTSKPSAQPSSRPSTSHPTSCPTAGPSKYPTTSNPTFKGGTNKPTILPTSTPTYDLRDYQSSDLYEEFQSNATFYSNRQESYTFSTFYYKGDTKNGTCQDWNDYTALQLQTPFTDIAFSEMHAWYTTYDYTTFQYQSIRAYCDIAYAVKNFVNSLVTGTDYAFNCYDISWRVFNCHGNRVFCLNCKQICVPTVACPGESDIINPCQSCHNHKALAAVVSFDYHYQVLYPQFIGNYTILQTTSQEIIIEARINAAGYVRCAAFPSFQSGISIGSIYAQGNYNFTTNINATSLLITIPNLLPQTNYVVYCYTEDFDQHIMDINTVLQYRIPFQTACCGSFYYQQFTSLLTMNSVPPAVFTVAAIPAPSASGVQVNASITGVSCQQPRVATSQTASITPSILILSSIIPTASFTISASLPGCYLISLVQGFGTQYQNITEIVQIVDSNNQKLPAPSVNYAKLGSDGLSIQIVFNSATNMIQGIVAGSKFSCSTLLNFGGVTNSVCSWQNASVLIVSLGANPSISVNSQIQIKGAKIKASCVNQALCSSYPTLNSTIISVLPPASPQLPIVSLSIPSLIASCDNLVIDATGSSGNGGRPWQTISWSVQSADLSAANLSVITSYFNTHIQSISSPYTVPNANLLVQYAPSSLTIGLTLVNFLGLSASTTAEVAINYDGISFPLISLLGGASTTAYRWMTITAQVQASLSTCNGNFPLQIDYLWAIYQSYDRITTVTSTSKDPRYFIINPYQLDAGANYSIQVKLQYYLGTSNPILLTSSQVISIGRSGVIAIIAGGNQQSVSTSSSVTVDGTKSYSIDYPEDYYSSLTFYWTCSSIYPVLGSSCSQNFPSSDTSVNFQFFLQGIYQVTLLVTDAYGASDTTTATFNVTSKPLPQIYINNTAANLVSAAKKLILTGSIWTKQATAQAVWTCDTLNLSRYSLTPLVKSIPFSATTLLSTFQLSLPPNLLNTGTSYVFTLLSYYDINAPAAASITVTTSSGPTGGSFTITPASGNALETSYLFQTSVWSVSPSGLPLIYLFACYQLDPSTSMIVKGRDQVTYISTQLGPGSVSSSYKLNCYVNATDSLGNEASLTKVITVLPVETSNSVTLISAISTATDDLIDSANQLQNPVAVNQAITTALYSINTVNCDVPISCKLLNRNLCSSTPKTCGSCLTGFIGQDGDSNLPCNLSTALQTIGGPCTSNFTCISGSCAKGVCQSVEKTCLSSCNYQGTCIKYSSVTNQRISYCAFDDDTCYTYCSCNIGYYGRDCTIIGNTQYQQTKTFRSNLCWNMNQLLSQQNVDQDILQNRASTITNILQDYTVLTTEGILNCTNAFVETVQLNPTVACDGYVPSLAAQTFTQLLTAFQQDPTSPLQTKLFNVVNNALQTLLTGCQSLMAIDESPFLLNYGAIRSASKVLGTSGTNAAETTVTAPQTAFEQFQRQPTAAISPKLLTNGNGYGLSVVNFINNPQSVFTNSTITQIITQPFNQFITTTDTTPTRRRRTLSSDSSGSTSSSNSSVTVTLPNHSPITYNSSMNYTVVLYCSEYRSEDYYLNTTCSEGMQVNVTCYKGTKGHYNISCPASFQQPVCTTSTTGNSFQADPSCSLLSYTGESTTCQCNYHSNEHRYFSTSQQTVYSSLLIVYDQYPPEETPIYDDSILITISLFTGLLVIVFCLLLRWDYNDFHEIKLVLQQRKKTLRTIDLFFADLLPDDFNIQQSWRTLFYHRLCKEHSILQLFQRNHDQLYLENQNPQFNFQEYLKRSSKWLIFMGKFLSFICINTIFVSIIFADNGYCNDFETKESCLSATTFSLLVKQSCVWESDNQTCRFNRPAVTVYTVIVYLLIIMIIAIPIHRMIELLVKRFIQLVVVTDRQIFDRKKGLQAKKVIAKKRVNMSMDDGDLDEENENDEDAVGELEFPDNDEDEEGGGIGEARNRKKTVDFQNEFDDLDLLQRKQQKQPSGGEEDEINRPKSAAGRNKKYRLNKIESSLKEVWEYGDELANCQKNSSKVLKAARITKMLKTIDYTLPSQESELLLQKAQQQLIDVGRSELIMSSKKALNRSTAVSRRGGGTNPYEEISDFTDTPQHSRYAMKVHSMKELVNKVNETRKTTDYLKDRLSMIAASSPYSTSSLIKQDIEIFLMKQFFIYNFPQVFHQNILLKYFFGSIQQQHYSSLYLFFRYFTFVLLLLFFVAIIGIVFYLNHNIGTHALILWFVIDFVALFEELVLIQPIKIFHQWIMINYSLIIEFYFMWIAMKLRFVAIMNRKAGAMSESSSLIQHFNPACRLARLYPQLPVSRLLLSLNDYDIPYFNRVESVYGVESAHHGHRNREAILKQRAIHHPLSWRYWWWTGMYFYQFVKEIFIWIYIRLPFMVQESLLELGIVLFTNLFLLAFYFLGLQSIAAAVIIAVCLVLFAYVYERKFFTALMHQKTLPIPTIFPNLPRLPGVGTSTSVIHTAAAHVEELETEIQAQRVKHKTRFKPISKQELSMNHRDLSPEGKKKKLIPNINSPTTGKGKNQKNGEKGMMQNVNNNRLINNPELLAKKSPTKPVVPQKALPLNSSVEKEEKDNFDYPGRPIPVVPALPFRTPSQIAVRPVSGEGEGGKLLKSTDILKPSTTTAAATAEAANPPSPTKNELAFKQRAAKRAQKRNQNLAAAGGGGGGGGIEDDDSQMSQLFSIHSIQSNRSGNSGLTPREVIERAQQRRVRKRQERHRHANAEQGGPGISSARRLLEEESKRSPNSRIAGNRAASQHPGNNTGNAAAAEEDDFSIPDDHSVKHSKNLQKYMKLNDKNELLPLDYNLGFQEQFGRRQMENLQQQVNGNGGGNGGSGPITPYDVRPNTTSSAMMGSRGGLGTGGLNNASTNSLRADAFSQQQRYPWMNTGAGNAGSGGGGGSSPQRDQQQMAGPSSMNQGRANSPDRLRGNQTPSRMGFDSRGQFPSWH